MIVADAGGEVPGDLAAAQHPVGAHRDLLLAAQRPPVPRDRGGDLLQVSFGGGEQ
jgi:hypothetical protein